MIVLTFLLTVLCVVIVRWLIKFNRFKKIVDVFPGRKGYFLLGDIMYFSNKPDEIFQQMRDYNKEFPEGYRIWAGPNAIININTPQHAEVILSSVTNNRKSDFYNFMEPWLKQGLLTVKEGPKWQKRRKLLTKIFHFNNLINLTDLLISHNDKIIADLENESTKEKTNITEMFPRYLLGILCQALLGVNLNVKDEKLGEYIKAILEYGQILNERFVKPWYYFDSIFNLSNLGKYQNKLLHVLHNFTKSLIEHGDQKCNKNKLYEDNKYVTMLDVLLHTKSKNEIDDSGITEEIDTFIFEGHDTISLTMACLLMLLANHKEHQDHVVTELREIFGNSDRKPTLEDFQNMNYLERCIKETLRLYPIVIIISRHAKEDIQLDDKYTIPQDCIINIHVFDIHRNETLFPNPNEFNPDRFLPDNLINKHPFSYIPFSAGPRNCIGQKLAMMMLKSIASSILRNYEVEPISTPENMKWNIEIILKPKNPIFVKFKKRNI